MRKVKGPFFEKIYNLDEVQHPYKYPLAERPFTVDIELTNNCNFLCAFCDRQIMKRPTGFMDLAVFKKIADDSAKIGVLGLRFIRWGEPYLHPRIFEMIKYAKSLGLLVHVTTNGMLMNEERARLTVESGLDNIIFSMQGVDEKGYLDMRQVEAYGKDQYKILVKNIETLMKTREELRADNPFVQVTTTTIDETAEQIEFWKKLWNEKVDLATHTGLTSFHRVQGQDRVKSFLNRAEDWKREKPCHEVLTKLAVNWNGDITACANDYDNFMILGNVGKMTLAEAWRSDKLENYRAILKRNDHAEVCEKIPYCGYCRNRF